MNNVSINILNYNTYEKSRKCIESCLKQDYKSFRILLVDNHSDDDSLIRLKKEYEDRIEYLELDRNYGYAAGNNKAVQSSCKDGYDICLLLNSDTVLATEFVLSELVDIYTKDPRIGIVAPLIKTTFKNGYKINSNDSNYLKILRLMKILPKNIDIEKNLKTVSEAHGSALLVDCNSFIKLEGFPEEYFMYNEESTLSKKFIFNNQIIIWDSNTQNYIIHEHDKSQEVDSWRIYLEGRNKGLEYYKFRNRYPLRWTIAFLLYITRLKIKNNIVDRIQYEGLKHSREIHHSSKESIFEDGLMIRNDLLLGEKLNNDY